MPLLAPVTSARLPLSPKSTAASLLFARQHAIDHLAGEAEIAGRVAHFLEVGAGEVLGDVRILGEEIDQRLAGRRDLAADVVDEVVRALAAEARAEPHHHRLRYDHAEREVEIGAHLLGVDL